MDYVAYMWFSKGPRVEAERTKDSNVAANVIHFHTLVTQSLRTPVFVATTLSWKHVDYDMENLVLFFVHLSTSFEMVSSFHFFPPFILLLLFSFSFFLLGVWFDFESTMKTLITITVCYRTICWWWHHQWWWWPRITWRCGILGNFKISHRDPETNAANR